MSSSSALVVGIATALSFQWRLAARADWTHSIQTPADLATYYASLENGATFARLDGDAGVGTHGGSEDHAAMLLGETGSLSAFSFVPMRLLDVVRLPRDWRIVVATSGVRAEKTGAAQDAYNRLSDGSRHLLAIWNRDRTPAHSLASALSSTPTAESELRELIADSDLPGWPPDALGRRLSHFVLEDARILSAVAALRTGDYESLSQMGDESQRDAAHLLGNQVPETIALAAAARHSGAFAACSFGAGFGGSVWALVGSAEATGFRQAWLDRYRESHPDREAIAFIADPAPPVTRLSAG